MKESDIKPGQFYFTNPSTRQLALSVEELWRVTQVDKGGHKTNGGDQLGVSTTDEKEARKRNEGRIAKLLGNRHKSGFG